MALERCNRLAILDGILATATPAETGMGTAEGTGNSSRYENIDMTDFDAYLRGL